MGAEADRPTEGKIKAARCGPVGRLKNVEQINDLATRCPVHHSLLIRKTS